MRAIERDRLLARAGWIYLVLLALVSAYFLWPRTIPPGMDAGALDLGALPVASEIDFDAVDTLSVTAAGATQEAEAAIRALIDEVGGSGNTLSIPIGDADNLFEVLQAFRTASRKYRRMTLVLLFTPSNAVVRVERGAFDDPGGRIGRALLERKLMNKAETSTPSAMP